jgi:hypothetical protein
MILNAMNVRVLGDEGCEISAGLENLKWSDIFSIQ